MVCYDPKDYVLYNERPKKAPGVVVLLLVLVMINCVNLNSQRTLHSARNPCLYLLVICFSGTVWKF